MPTEQESLEGGVGKLRFNFMFDISGCTWQYYKTIFHGGKWAIPSRNVVESLEMWDLAGLKKMLPDPKW